MEHVVDCLVAGAAGVVIDYIRRWLDRDRKGR